jgi:D-beta-D-heptose 7-phosphate kinase/D-beta-D-heptose 1-phosphate adenosyltransferase
MILATRELPQHQGHLTMADGGFDPLHAGHIAYFREAARLGPPLLCNVAPDSWVARKHPPLLSQAERVEVIDAIRHVAYTHPSDTTTADVLALVRPKYYAKGADWEGRLPQAELDVCEEHGIEVVYLDTVSNSSTAILDRYSSQ